MDQTTMPTWATVCTAPCITVYCADCKDAYGEEPDAPWHFTSIDAALKVFDESRWTIQDGRAICECCTRERLCLSFGGHAWERSDTTRPHWHCTRCPTGTVVPPDGEG